MERLPRVLDVMSEDLARRLFAQRMAFALRCLLTLLIALILFSWALDGSLSVLLYRVVGHVGLANQVRLLYKRCRSSRPTSPPAAATPFTAQNTLAWSLSLPIGSFLVAVFAHMAYCQSRYLGLGAAARPLGVSWLSTFHLSAESVTTTRPASELAMALNVTERTAHVMQQGAFGDAVIFWDAYTRLLLTLKMFAAWEPVMSVPLLLPVCDVLILLLGLLVSLLVSTAGNGFMEAAWAAECQWRGVARQVVANESEACKEAVASRPSRRARRGREPCEEEGEEMTVMARGAPHASDGTETDVVDDVALKPEPAIVPDRGDAHREREENAAVDAKLPPGGLAFVDGAREMDGDDALAGHSPYYADHLSRGGRHGGVGVRGWRVLMQGTLGVIPRMMRSLLTGWQWKPLVWVPAASSPVEYLSE